MKRPVRTSILVLGLVLMTAQMSSGQLSGSLSGTLGPGNYTVVGEIRIDEGNTLTLAPLTTFTFVGPYAFTINGTLLAVGVAGDSIGFTTDLTQNPDRWRGLRFYSGSSGGRMAYCVIERGYAEWPNNLGGGVYCEGSSPSFENCAIRDNWAGYGGGVCSMWGSSPTFTNCTISGDSASYFGGGVCYSASSPAFTSCTISRNSASRGGGAYCDYSSASFTNCTLSGNSGGVNGGGVCCTWGSSPIFTNCTLSGNSAIGGGGVYCEESFPRFDNTIIAFSTGSGIHFLNSPDTQVEYSDIFGNSGGNLEGEVPPELGDLVTTNANGDPADVYQNIFLDPQFVNAAGGNYHLADVSRCIGAGDPTDPPPTDMDGNPRPNPSGSNPDIGAYENSFAVPQIPGECESSPDTIYFRGPSGPPYFDRVSRCVHLCHNRIYTAIFPWCSYVTPEVPNEIEIFGGCSDCGTEAEDCTPAAGWIVSPWVMMYPSDWTAQIFLAEGGIEGCACVSVVLWLEMQWVGDCWLPVELASFDAVPESGNIRIRFSTASEQDNDYFEIMRGTSEEGTFSAIVRLPSQGPSSGEQHYDYLDREVEPGRTYWYYLADVDMAGQRSEHRERLVSATASVEAVPLTFRLDQNFPNPFNATTTIRYALPEAGNVDIAVLNVLGERVATLRNGWSAAGIYEVQWNASHAASGVYLYQIRAGDFVQTKKMVLMK